MFDYKKAFTHGGIFHADDVFSSAFLRILNPNIKIERGFKVPENYNGLIFDIGDGEFDHHSEPRESRENGIIYASFGKLWRKYGPMYYSDFVVSSVDKSLILDLDNSDNTGTFSSLSMVINAFNKFWNEDESADNFEQAVSLAKIILERVIQRYIESEKAVEAVKRAEEESQNGVVVLDVYMPWKNLLNPERTKVVIYPSVRGGVNAERLEDSGFEFPKEWWGSKNPDKLAVGLTFCHASGFLAAFKTKEDALNSIMQLLS